MFQQITWNFRVTAGFLIINKILIENAFLFAKLRQLKLLTKVCERVWNRVGKKPGKFRKTNGNGKNWFLPGKMGKTGKTVFFWNKCLKTKINYRQINSETCWQSKEHTWNDFSSWNEK
jgi:hypothetical protein